MNFSTWPLPTSLIQSGSPTYGWWLWFLIKGQIKCTPWLSQWCSILSILLISLLHLQNYYIMYINRVPPYPLNFTFQVKQPIMYTYMILSHDDDLTCNILSRNSPCIFNYMIFDLEHTINLNTWDLLIVLLFYLSISVFKVWTIFQFLILSHNGLFTKRSCLNFE